MCHLLPSNEKLVILISNSTTRNIYNSCKGIAHVPKENTTRVQKCVHAYILIYHIPFALGQVVFVIMSRPPNRRLPTKILEMDIQVQVEMPNGVTHYSRLLSHLKVVDHGWDIWDSACQ